MKPALFLPTIETPGEIIRKEQIHVLIEQVFAQIDQNALCEKSWAFFPKNNWQSLVFILAAIKLKKRLFLLSEREPFEVQKKIFASFSLKNIFCIEGETSSFSVDQETYVQPIKLVPSTFCSSKKCELQVHALDFESVIKTSGTSGDPKFLLTKLAAHLSSAQSVAEYFSLDHQCSFALCLPLFHVSGLSILFRALLSGARIFVGKNLRDLTLAINEGKISHISLVPTQLKQLLEKNCALKKCRAIIVGGDRLPEDLETICREKKLNIFTCYGSSETSSMVLVNKFLNQGIVQTIFPHCRLQISSSSELLIASESLGEAYIKSAHDPGEKLSPLFKSGDLARKNAGRIEIIGRKNNRIISGGENIQAEEIEKYLLRHPKIYQAVVVGKCDEKYGQRPVAIVDARGKKICPEEIKKFLQNFLSDFKLPDHYLMWPRDLPSGLKPPRKVLENFARKKFLA